MRLLSVAVACLTVSAFAQQPTQFEGRSGLRLASDKLEITILTQGTSMVNLVLRDDPEKLDPLWNPVRMARETGQKSPTGSGLGHFVCVDGFGPVSKEEQAAGLQGHGEAHRQEFAVVSSGKEGKTTSLTLRATLPLLQEVFTRSIRLVDGENVIYVASELDNLLSFDRPVCWAEHATIGSPFLEPGKTVVDMAAVRAKTRPHSGRQGMPHRLKSFEDFTWPMAPGADGGLLDLRAAPLQPNSGDHTTCLMDPKRELVFVTALHPDKRLLVGYLFKPDQFPWTQNWEHYPSNGKLARGLEFSTMPFDVPRREAISTGAMFDTPTYRWLPAKAKITSSFYLFYARTPEGFQRVDDARLENGQIIIEDRKSGKRMTLAASIVL